jgi:hypothetical protein
VTIPSKTAEAGYRRQEPLQQKKIPLKFLGVLVAIFQSMSNPEADVQQNEALQSPMLGLRPLQQGGHVLALMDEPVWI